MNHKGLKKITQSSFWQPPKDASLLLMSIWQHKQRYVEVDRLSLPFPSLCQGNRKFVVGVKPNTISSCCLTLSQFLLLLRLDWCVPGMQRVTLWQLKKLSTAFTATACSTVLLEGFAAQVFCCSRALLLKAFDAQASRALLLKVFLAQFHGVSLVMIIMVMSHSLTLLVRDILNTETANDVISSSVPFCFWINQNFAVIIPVKAYLLGTWSE